MSTSVARQVAGLEKLDLKALRGRWKELFGTEPPRYSGKFLRKRLAYRLQELAFGGLSETAHVRMRQILAEGGFDEDGRPAGRKVKKLKNMPVAGTRLVREWQGQRHEATVVGGGFEFEGRRYKSLSAIARAITGTRWNGPAFFGLRK